jgi:hypothetical protein
MLVSTKYNFIFVHVNKTGGTSIRKSLTQYCEGGDFLPGHLNFNSKSFNYYLPKLDDTNRKFKFGFVRNPWDKMVSQYFYNRARWVNRSCSFKEYIKYFGEGNQISYFGPTCSSFLSTNKTINVDFVGKYENLQNDFDYISEKIGVKKITLPHVMKNKRRNKKIHYSEFYDIETRKIVEKKFEEDIEHWKYRF